VLGLGPLCTSARAGLVMREARELSLRPVCAVARAESVKHVVHITYVTPRLYLMKDESENLQLPLSTTI
jgi:hypothetical protein